MTPDQWEGLQHYAARGYSDPEIAGILGVSSRTVLRWRQKWGIASTWEPQAPSHGTIGRYRAGCRNACCRAANARAAATLRQAYNAAVSSRKNRSPWTPAEDAVLLTAGGSLISRARTLERSYDACRRRLDTLRNQGQVPT